LVTTYGQIERADMQEAYLCRITDGTDDTMIALVFEGKGTNLQESLLAFVCSLTFSSLSVLNARMVLVDRKPSSSKEGREMALQLMNGLLGMN